MTKVSSFYVTIIAFATSATSARYSKLSDAVLVTRFFSKFSNLERNLVICSERSKHIFLKNLYELRETLFDILDAIKIP